jgi:hypothetical protein
MPSNVNIALRISASDAILSPVNYRRTAIAMKSQLEETVAEVGGELLDGSTFETTGEGRFSAADLLASVSSLAKSTGL